MKADGVASSFWREVSGSSYARVQKIFEKLKGKKIRFCLKNNNYDSIVYFEAVMAEFYACEQTDSEELADLTYKIENDKGIEIHVPVQKLIRIDEPDNVNTNSYFLIFERHFWSLEVLTG